MVLASTPQLLERRPRPFLAAGHSAAFTLGTCSAARMRASSHHSRCVLRQFVANLSLKAAVYRNPQLPILPNFPAKVHVFGMGSKHLHGLAPPVQGAQIEILCTHPVRFAVTCLATSGPTNISAASVYNNDYGWVPPPSPVLCVLPTIQHCIVNLPTLSWEKFAPAPLPNLHPQSSLQSTSLPAQPLPPTASLSPGDS